jgi:chromosome partitioning protein
MSVTVASYKGGVSKTTTAIHLATHFQEVAPTILIDGDPNRCVSTMAKRGGMPFTIADESEGLYTVRNFKHVNCRYGGPTRRGRLRGLGARL